MTFEPTPPQQQVIASTKPLLVVLGGAGTGKTTTACAAARAHLERRHVADRVLFLSFSRASVSRVQQRARGVVGSWGPYIEVTTFHALAWSIVWRFGSVLGHARPILRPPAYRRLLGGTSTLDYDDLLPLALRVIEASEPVQQHLEKRWGLVVVDEYQDTGDLHAQLVDQVSRGARQILLGDPNQCIYTFLRRQGVRPERIEEAARRAGDEGVVSLPREYHRDKSGLIPAIAEAIMHREFDNEAIQEGLRTGRLAVDDRIAPDGEVEAVASRVRALVQQNLGVGVYCHHNDMLTSLSDGLRSEGVDHDISGPVGRFESRLDCSG